MSIIIANPINKKLIKALNLEGQSVTGLRFNFQNNNVAEIVITRCMTQEEIKAVFTAMSEDVKSDGNNS